MFKVVPKKANNSIQNVLMNLPALSLMMLDEMPHNFTTCLKNSWAVSSVEHNLGVGTNVTYFENWSTITKMASYSPTFGRCVMKSRDTLSQGLVGTGRGSKSLILWLSRLCLVGRWGTSWCTAWCRPAYSARSTLFYQGICSLPPRVSDP